MPDQIQKEDPNTNPFPLLWRGFNESLTEGLLVTFAGFLLILLFPIWARSSGHASLLTRGALLLGMGAAIATILYGIVRIARRNDDPGLFMTGAVLFGMSQFLRSPEVVRFLTILPASVIVWSFLRVIRRADELQRRILNQALAFAYVVTFVATLGYTLLEKAGLPKSGAATWFLLLLTGFWVGLGLASRRYSG